MSFEKVICFNIDALPVAQPRQRHTVSKAGFARNYTPKTHPVNSFKSAVAWSAKSAYSGPLIDSPIKLFIKEIFPRPKYMTKKRFGLGRVPKDTKPDFDNASKSVCDALNGVIWVDDAKIFDAHVSKYYGCPGELASVFIEVRW